MKPQSAKTSWALLMAIAVLLAVIAPAFGAGDPQVGATKAITCTGCHGPQGVSPNDLWPNLAGQQPRYLVKQMKAFRDGTRADPMMGPFSRNLSDQDIEDIAAWYASLDCQGESDEVQ